MQYDAIAADGILLGKSVGRPAKRWAWAGIRPPFPGWACCRLIVHLLIDTRVFDASPRNGAFGGGRSLLSVQLRVDICSGLTH
jgi:hypothetical protein